MKKFVFVMVFLFAGMALAACETSSNSYNQCASACEKAYPDDFVRDEFSACLKDNCAKYFDQSMTCQQDGTDSSDTFDESSVAAYAAQADSQAALQETAYGTSSDNTASRGVTTSGSTVTKKTVNSAGGVSKSIADDGSSADESSDVADSSSAEDGSVPVSRKKASFPIPLLGLGVFLALVAAGVFFYMKSHKKPAVPTEATSEKKRG